MWMKKVQKTRVRPVRTTWLTDEDDGVFVRTTPLTLCDVLSHNAQCNKHGKYACEVYAVYTPRRLQ